MRYFAVDGDEIPALGLGTWRLVGTACRRVVADALAMGYRHLDTAQRYGNEGAIGQAVKRSGVARDDLFLTTKLDLGNATHAAVRRSTFESLRRLRTDYVDLLMIHWPDPDVPLGETLGAMEELRAEGGVRHIGVCNFPKSLLDRACGLARLVTNQVEYHPYLAQAGLLRRCHEQDLFLTAHAPLARGRVLDNAVVRDIATGHGLSPAQVVLRWLIQQPRVAAIPKTASSERLASNLDVFGFELSDDEMDRISSLSEGRRVLDPPHAPDWDA